MCQYFVRQISILSWSLNDKYVEQSTNIINCGDDLIYVKFIFMYTREDYFFILIEFWSINKNVLTL